MMGQKPISQTGRAPAWLKVCELTIYVALLAWAALGLRHLLPPIGRTLMAQWWAPTDCTIVRSGVSSAANGPARFDISFRYAFEGHEHTSDRYEFEGVPDLGGPALQEVMRRHPAGSRAVCYVNPRRPGEAVLSRAVRPGMLIGALLGALFLTCFYKSARILLELRARRRGGTPLPLLPGAAPADQGAPGGSVTLQPTERRLGLFFGLLALALVFNSCVWSVIVPDSLFEVRGFSAMSLWSLSFALAFPLFGAVVLGVTVYVGLGLLNPQIVIQLDPPRIPLGADGTITWSFRGRHRRIRRLTIEFEGREEARRTEGGDDVTDCNVFHSILLVDAREPSLVASGRATACVPRHLVPSFAAGGNRIFWCLKVRGEIRHWPDIIHEFEVPVAPIASGDSSPAQATCGADHGQRA